MRIDLVPEGWLTGWLEWLALRTNWVPAPFLINCFLGMGTTRSFLAGARLGVFDALAEGPKSTEEIAQITECDPHGMETLLRALNGFGYLQRRDGKYSNTRQIERWYLESARFSMREVVPFIGDLWNMLEGLEEGVRTGQVENFHHAGKSPEFWSNYLRALATFGMFAGREIGARVKLKKDSQRLLDVGGGHGVYSAAIARRYPQLQVDILDLPEAVVVGRQIAEERGWADRVQYREGDLRTADWGEGYDAVMLFNVLHTLSPEECLDAIKKAMAALKPGGSLLILDAQHRIGEGDIPQLTGYNELFFFLVAGGATIYPERTIQQWMRQANFSQIKKKRLYSVPGTVLLSGTREA